MGTPSFAVPTLEAILESKNHKLVGVFSQAAKAKGRGLRIIRSPVHEVAYNNSIPVYTPLTLKTDDVNKLINSMRADIIIVVAYGLIIPKNILEAKKFGCLNIHPSNLPKYRGAAPLQRMIINGERKSAVCIIQMDTGVDTGDIIAKKNFPLSNQITLVKLYDYTAQIGAKMMIEVLDNIETIKPSKQLKSLFSYAHKLSAEESKINWDESAFLIDCKVRGMNPWPGVYFKHQNKRVKIIKTSYLDSYHQYNPGLLLENDGSFFDVACNKGVLRILEVKPESKSIMCAQDYLFGFQRKDKITQL